MILLIEFGIIELAKLLFGIAAKLNHNYISKVCKESTKQTLENSHLAISMKFLQPRDALICRVA